MTAVATRHACPYCAHGDDDPAAFSIHVAEHGARLRACPHCGELVDKSQYGGHVQIHPEHEPAPRPGQPAKPKTERVEAHRLRAGDEVVFRRNGGTFTLASVALDRKRRRVTLQAEGAAPPFVVPFTTYLVRRRRDHAIRMRPDLEGDR